MFLLTEAFLDLPFRFLERKFLLLERKLLASWFPMKELVRALADVVVVVTRNFRREIVDRIRRNESHKQQHDCCDAQQLVRPHFEFKLSTKYQFDTFFRLISVN